MKKLTSLFMVVLAAGNFCLYASNVQMQAQPNSSGEAFPFEIGNKWYYQHTISRSEYGVYTQIVSETTWEIIDTTSDGTRIVQVVDLSTHTISSGQLRYATDRSLYPGTVELFGNRYPSMTTSHSDPPTPHDSKSWSTSVALGIGLYQQSTHETHSGRIYDDTEYLVGMLLGGVVYGDTLVSPSSVDREPELPLRAGLYQNYPNPFNPSTTIKYELPKSSEVKLSVYDILGREVSVLVNEKKDAGVHEVRFEGNNLASGVYFYRLQAGDFVQTRKLLLLR